MCQSWYNGVKATRILAQLKGKNTNRQYKVAAIFVDIFSQWVHVELLSYLSCDLVVQACNAFEALSRGMGDSVQHYHCDNGKFSDNAFKNNWKAKKETLHNVKLMVIIRMKFVMNTLEYCQRMPVKHCGMTYFVGPKHSWLTFGHIMLYKPLE